MFEDQHADEDYLETTVLDGDGATDPAGGGQLLPV